MPAQEDSPNWHWQLLGYQIERQPLPGGGSRRTIRRPDGSTVEIDRRDGEHQADAEVRVAQAERHRFPHGAEECAKAQLDIFNNAKEPAA